MLENQMFEIKSGEVKTIDYIRKTGARVQGKLTWQADAKLHDITVTVVGEPVQKSPFNDHQWATVYAALTPTEDGTFLTERIPPGTYELAAYAYKESTGEEALLSGFSAPSLYAAVTIKVPAEGEVKVDDLALKTSRAGAAKEPKAKEEKPAAKKDQKDEKQQPLGVEAMDKPFVVHAILESVDAKGAMITAKWVTGNDADSVLWLFASRGDLLDPKVFVPRDSVQLSPENNPKLVNVPVRPSAKIVSGKETLLLKDLRAGSVVSLQLAADPMKGFVIVGIEVTDLHDLTHQLFGVPRKP